MKWLKQLANMTQPLTLIRFLLTFPFTLVYITLLTACESVPISEPDTIGHVTKASGFPVVNRHNQEYILARRSDIYPADIFDTDEKSMVEMTFADSSVITLSRKSHLVLHHFDEAGDSHSMDLNLTKGAIRARLPHHRELELRTPLGYAKLSGGEFLARIVNNTLEVVMLDGRSLIVGNRSGEVILDRPGLGTTVIAGSAPQSTYLWSNRKLRQVEETTLIP